MDSPGEILSLCRLCLVKDQVNIPIFEEQGDIRQIFLKISSCLPVTITRHDQLPKKICDACSNKLDLLYEFWNSSASAEKTLLSWLGQAGVKDAGEKISAVAQQIAKPAETLVKEESEALDESQLINEANVINETNLTNESRDSFEEHSLDEDTKDEAEAPPPKRARRTAAVKAQINITPESDEDDDEDYDAGDAMTKMEDESDESESELKDDPSYSEVPGTSADDQAGPSGVGKDGVEAPYFDTSILNNLIYGPGISITPIKPENGSTSTSPNRYQSKHFLNYNNFENLSSANPFNGINNAFFSKILEPQVNVKAQLDNSFEATHNDLKIENNILYDSLLGTRTDFTSIKIKEEPDPDRPNILDCLLENKKPVKKRKEKNTEKPPPPVDLDEPIECDVCNLTFKNNVAFALHSIDHSQDKKYYCHLCDFKNTSKYHIEMHVRAHEGTTKYKCEVCGKAFTISTHAIEHKYFHTGEKPFQCEICGKHFMFSWFLTSHRRTQHWEIVTGSPLVKYDCTICNKHYTSSTGLKRHNMTHHGSPGVDNSVLCDICGKSLSSKEKLKFHRRIHTGYKPFSCEICTKSFSRKEQLKEHERVHTGEKPYICKFCGKGFTQRSPLRIHERTHTGERPYTCMICQKGFISKGVMDTHMKTCSVSRTAFEPQYDF